MKDLIQSIQNRLSQINLLKYVDMDWGQLDLYTNHSPVKWPCALIDIPVAQYTNQGNAVQLGIITIGISIADLRLSNSSNAAPNAQKERALAIYELINQVYQKLHGWTALDNYSALIRQSYLRQQRQDGLIIHRITYTCQINDTEAKRISDSEPAPTPKFVVKLAH